MITLDEYMSMSKEELDEFHDRDERLITEGLVDENQPNIDLMGMTSEEIIQRYNLVPITQVYDNITKKLNGSK